MRTVSRRQLLTQAVVGAAALALGGRGSGSSAESMIGAPPLPHPDQSGMEHVVVVMMENRSFDHYLGWLPHADGKQAGLSYLDASGVRHATYPLGADDQGCGRNDPDHSYRGGRIAYDGGRCDGWLRNPANDLYCIGYYTQNNLPFLGKAAPRWTVCDRYFAAIMAETFPNRIYQHAAQTDRLHNTTRLCTLPTIWDRLAGAGLSGRYYYGNVPFLALWGVRHLAISRPFSAFLADCAAGMLPHVSFVDPHFTGVGGNADDDHPHADIRNGEHFLAQVYQAVTTGPTWGSTLLVITFDEWGGFFDHVAPRPAPIPPADRRAGNRDGLRGFRVPCLLISPWSHRRVVHHRFDHTSVLKLIAWRWELTPLSVRDASANNLALALEFTSPRLTPPAISVPAGPFGHDCGGSSFTPPRANWSALRTLASQYGWPV